MTLISHSTACKQYPIGRSTLRALVADGQLVETSETGTNGFITRLVRTEDLDSLGYVARRAVARGVEERPFLEQQVERLQQSMTDATHQHEELVACINLLRAEVADLSRMTHSSVRVEASTASTVGGWWSKVRHQWQRHTLRSLRE